jgi:hypothetical protein
VVIKSLTVALILKTGASAADTAVATLMKAYSPIGPTFRKLEAKPSKVYPDFFKL